MEGRQGREKIGLMREIDFRAFHAHIRMFKVEILYAGVIHIFAPFWKLATRRKNIKVIPKNMC